MKLTERIWNLYEDYLNPVVTGATLPYVAKTALRRGDEQHSRTMETDQREHSIAEPPFGVRRIDWLDSQRQNLLYCLGMGASLGLTGGVINYGLNRLAHEQDPKVLLSTLGAIIVGNVASLVYERLRPSYKENPNSA